MMRTVGALFFGPDSAIGKRLKIGRVSERPAAGMGSQIGDRQPEHVWRRKIALDAPPRALRGSTADALVDPPRRLRRLQTDRTRSSRLSATIRGLNADTRAARQAQPVHLPKDGIARQSGELAGKSPDYAGS